MAPNGNIYVAAMKRPEAPRSVAENGPERQFLCGGYEAAGGAPGPWPKMAPNGHFYVVAAKPPKRAPGPWPKMAPNGHFYVAAVKRLEGPRSVAENGPKWPFLCGGCEAAGGGPGPWGKMAPNGDFYVAAVKPLEGPWSVAENSVGGRKWQTKALGQNGLRGPNRKWQA
jgi:hypothetical protein